MNTNNIIPMILVIIIAMIILSIAAACFIGVFEEKLHLYKRFYIYPVFKQKPFESYPAPYCPHCGSRLNNKQKFCRECGAGFIWPELKMPDFKANVGLDDKCTAAYKKIFDDFNKKGTY